MHYIGIRKIGRKFLFLTNILAATGLLVCWLSSFWEPTYAWLIVGLLGMFYPILLVINILFIGFWFLLNKKYMYLSLVVVAISLFKIQALYTFNFSNQGIKSPIEIDSLQHNHQLLGIMSYNVRLFNEYKWIKDKGMPDSIANCIIKNKPTILCLQEALYTMDSSIDILDKIKTKAFLPYSHANTITRLSGKKDNYTGNIILSAYPIIRSGVVDFGENTHNSCIYSDIELPNQTRIRVYNTHLQSFRFEKKDYALLKKIKEADAWEEADKNTSKTLLLKMKEAIIQRAEQVAKLQNHIQRSPYPVILSGDFNDPPVSHTYYQLTEDLQDSFLESSRGIGTTYNGIIPFLRIDYILHDIHFKAYNHRIIPVKFSDHYPVFSYVEPLDNK